MKFNAVLLILTFLAGGVLIYAGQNPFIAVIVGGLIWLMLHFLWSPPPKHKDFADRDRLEATSSALGGTGAPPELPFPDIPEKKHDND